MINTDILVIGAGLAGLTAATELTKKGHNVIVVEKARGSGGRLSSKRVAVDGLDDIGFDLGCTGLTASTALFRAQLKRWVDQGVAAHWAINGLHGAGTSHGTETNLGTGTNKVVGLPRNSSITRNLANGIDVKFATRISALRKQGDYWESYLESDVEEQPFTRSKRVIIATPPQQAADLLGEKHPLHTRFDHFHMQPQWVVMLALEKAQSLTGVTLSDLPVSISGLSLESSKRGQVRTDEIAVWQFQASPKWTEEHLDWPKKAIVDALIDEINTSLGCQLKPVASYAHRWLYSFPDSSVDRNVGKDVTKIEEAYLWNEDGVGCCGDYLASSLTPFGAEAAFLSGLMLAKSSVSLALM